MRLHSARSRGDFQNNSCVFLSFTRTKPDIQLLGKSEPEKVHLDLGALCLNCRIH